MPYYEVRCKCGHVGKDHYIPISFAIYAENAKTAAYVARWMPRAKHHHSDCIISVKEIEFKEYIKLREDNDNDPYLKCHSIQEQRQCDLSNRICNEKQYIDDEDETEDKKIAIGKTIIKNVKKYLRLYGESKEIVFYGCSAREVSRGNS